MHCGTSTAGTAAQDSEILQAKPESPTDTPLLYLGSFFKSLVQWHKYWFIICYNCKPIGIQWPPWLSKNKELNVLPVISEHFSAQLLPI